MSENETKKIYITKEEYEADTNYSSRKIHREKFKVVVFFFVTLIDML